MSALASSSSSATRPSPLREFGRFQLRRLLGKSSAAMVWLAFDPRSGHEVMLTLPRHPPLDANSLDRWLAEARQAARLDHPHLARAIEIDSQDQWPFVAVDRAQGVTLAEWLAGHPKPPPLDSVGWMLHALAGLAFAHEAGFAHLDLQLHSLVVGESGVLRVMALGAALPAAPAGDAAASRRRAQRDAAQTDLLACGVLLHRLLSDAAVLGEPDMARVVARMAPLGREAVRLPWVTPHPVPEALRVIANRATSDLPQRRYLNARTLLRALEGWRDALAQGGAGPLGLVLDRLRSVGHLPALPGLADRLAGLAARRGPRTDEMAEQVLPDAALSLELLRSVNSAQVQGTQMGGGGAVTTVRRAIALLGVDGVRAAANSLRVWPGPLAPDAATALQRGLDQAALAGHLARALRPAGYDAEVVYIVTLLQNLGRLLLQYHFSDESAQIRQLMQPALGPGGAELPGLGEDAASYAVLGVDTESVGSAVARHWGLGDEVLHMLRRLPIGKPVRKPDTDADLLRLVASAANEVVDASALGSPARSAAALAQIAQRYARVLNLTERDLREALLAARSALANVGTPAGMTPHEASAAVPLQARAAVPLQARAAGAR